MACAAQLVVGTAGHIDHGKSSLVRALTGTDPDRLPEEKVRGMTIDLGFAHTVIDGCDVWFVDVPGHERFIRNMVAGATGVDLALFVVAADDSVMPQTREHAEVLQLLGVEQCIVALTKLDLVDEEWADAVEQEVRSLLDSLGISVRAVVRTSVVDGRGLEELRAALRDAARSSQARRALYAWFRLPIDRAFNVPGRGTVVTGSVYHGSVRRDDELELWPAGRRVRVRDLQSHHVERDQAAGRMRLALNLAGVALSEVQRGYELASPGYLQPTRCLDVLVARLRMPGRTVRQRLRLRVHLGTCEAMGELLLAVRPGAAALSDQMAQLRTEAPVVATWGQRFILRDSAGTQTLGGGQVLAPCSRPWNARDPVPVEGMRILREGTPTQRLEETIRLSGWEPGGHAPLAARAGLADADQARELAQQSVERGRIVALEVSGQRAYVHMDQIRAATEALRQRLGRYLEANPRAIGLPESQWAGWMPRACPQRLRTALAELLVQRGAFERRGGFIAPAGTRPEIPAEDRELLNALLAEFEAAGFQPPAVQELRCRTPANQRRLDELIARAVAQGELVRIAPGMWLHQRRYRELVGRVMELIRRRGAVSVAEIRDALGSTRKYVVPIVEHLDAAGITRRHGDLRRLGPKALEASASS